MRRNLIKTTLFALALSLATFVARLLELLEPFLDLPVIGFQERNRVAVAVLLSSTCLCSCHRRTSCTVTRA